MKKLKDETVQFIEMAQNANPDDMVNNMLASYLETFVSTLGEDVRLGDAPLLIADLSQAERVRMIFRAQENLTTLMAMDESGALFPNGQFVGRTPNA